MLDIKYIKENLEKVKEAAKNRGLKIDFARILELDEKRRSALQAVESMRAEQNQVSYIMSKTLDATERERRLQEMRNLKESLQSQEAFLEEAEEELDNLLREVPNIPYPEVPIGKSEEDNVVLREVGKRRNFDFEPKDYLTLAQTHDLIDIKRAAKVSGSRFGYIKNELALLEFALVQYTMNILAKENFVPVIPPVLVKPEYMEAMGFLQGEAKDDVYYLEKDGLYLVGTSEQSIGPMHAGEILREKDLPLRYAGFSTCFRREAGSYGKDTKGILRVHQFDKIEMVSFVHPEKSREEHRFLLSLNERMIQDLELPYRVVHISTGDLSLPKAEQFDIETWIPSESRYRETHSASNTTDFQARRLGIKYKTEKGEKMFVHMLNDTAFAVGRTLIALLENFQQKDGTIKVPKALQKYSGLQKIPKD